MKETPSQDGDHLHTLAQTLRERITVIADRAWYTRDPAGHLEALKSVSERIETLQSALFAKLDPRLRHYLERCSYDKALAYLNGETVGEDGH